MLSTIGTSSCPSPTLTVNILPRRIDEYDGVYLRDFVVFSSSFLPGQLLQFHDLHEMPSRSFIDAYYPFSISEMSIKNIANNPETITTVQYNEINRHSAIYQIQFNGNIDMYRWRYEPEVTDIPTLCEEGYRLSSNQCVCK